MTKLKTLRLIGAPGSPYSLKMLSLMRYRRIPYSVIWGMPETVLDQLGIEKPKPAFMPTFLFDDSNGQPQAVCDSTPIIRRLEQIYDGRSVLPTDPALAFIDYLIEDFADEWLTKYMFHFRWHPREDADNAGTLLPLSSGMRLDDEQAAQFKEMFTQRQISRLSYVGSSELTAPVIENSYRRFFEAMQAHLCEQPYLFGDRPGAADFAIYGQMSQLVGFDPTPRAIAHDLAPRAVAWVYTTADLSGLEPEADQWTTLESQPETLKGVLREFGRVYAPALLANAEAVRADEKEWQTEIDGKRWQQRSFPYQAKCLGWINEQYQTLSDSDRQRVDRFLDGTGVEAILNRA